jgi:aspartate racemase
MKTVGLLGTNFTMEQDFYKGRLTEKHGLKIIVPSKADRQFVDRIIYEELCLGIVKAESRQTYLQIMKQMQKEGVEGIIEGCTEIAMLVQQQHTDIPLFDTTAIHAEGAVNMALTSTL